MLDHLLGRAGLKSEIAALEEETDRLRRQLEAEQDRRAEAQTARQEAERRENRLEDRVAELEDRVDRLQTDDGEVSFPHEETLSGPRLAEVLDRLASFSTGPEGAFSAYVADEHDLPESVRQAFGTRTPLVRRAAAWVNGGR